MPKHGKDARYRRTDGSVPRGPEWISARKSVSYRRRGLLHDVVGERYDRSPCPHTLRTRELIDDPMTGPDQFRGRTAVKVTDAPCVRPDGHGYVDGVFHPDSPEAPHADATGRTW